MIFSSINTYITTITEITDTTVELEYCINIDSEDQKLEFKSLVINNNILKHIYLDENIVQYMGSGGYHLYIVITMTITESNGMLQYKFEKTEDKQAKEYMDKINAYVDSLFSGPEWEEVEKNLFKSAPID